MLNLKDTNLMNGLKKLYYYSSDDLPPDYPNGFYICDSKVLERLQRENFFIDDQTKSTQLEISLGIDFKGYLHYENNFDFTDIPVYFYDKIIYED